MKFSKELLKVFESNKLVIEENPKSVLPEFEEFLALHDIYLSYNAELFHKTLKGRHELCDDILKFYEKASLTNERISFLEDLFIIGYDRDKLVELVLEVFETEPYPSNLWEYGALLYNIKNHKYLSRYIKIIENKSYGTARQMIVLLVGKSKREEVIPVLKSLLNDPDVYGHALDALTNFSGEDIEDIMMQYINHKVTWVRNTAKKYLKKKGILC